MATVSTRKDSMAVCTIPCGTLAGGRRLSETVAAALVTPAWVRRKAMISQLSGAERASLKGYAASGESALDMSQQVLVFVGMTPNGPTMAGPWAPRPLAP